MKSEAWVVKREKQYRINTVPNHYLHKQYRITTFVYQIIKRLQQRVLVISDRILGLYTSNCALVNIYETKLVVE